MKRFALIALAFVALLEVGLVFQGEAQVGLTGSSSYFPPPSATSSWFRKVNLDTIKVWHYDNIYSLARIKFGPAPMSDTLRMRSDTTVALIFLRGRGDSAWAFKARKGTTTWNTLMSGDTSGNISGSGTFTVTGTAQAGNFATTDRFFLSGSPSEGYHPHSTFGSNFVNARGTAGYLGRFYWLHTINDTTTAKGAIMYLDSTHLRVKLGDIDATGKSVLADTLKAKVVATTAMSELWNMPNTAGTVYSTNWVNTVGAIGHGIYSKTANAEWQSPVFPHRHLNGAKVIFDSVIVWGSCEPTTDTLSIYAYSYDTTGYRSTTLLTKKVGGGSRAYFRQALAWPTADTSAYLKIQGIDFATPTGIADTVGVQYYSYKYHTIP